MTLSEKLVALHRALSRGRVPHAFGGAISLTFWTLNPRGTSDIDVNVFVPASDPTRVLSALELKEVAEPYIRRRAIRHLEKGRVVIFAAGTGNPFFTTDTAAALRALEINADAILMAKHGTVGVFADDPRLDPDALFLPELTHREALERNVRVMDTTALSLCMDNNLPIYVFQLARGNIRRVLEGERIGTIISTPAKEER